MTQRAGRRLTRLVFGAWCDLTVPQRRRRLVVTVALSAYPAFMLEEALLGTTGVPTILRVVAAAAILTIMFATLRRVVTYQNALARQPDAALDERQISVRDRAYLVAYRWFALAVLGCLLVARIAVEVHVAPGLWSDLIPAFLWGALLYSVLLPSAVVAWETPDSADDLDPQTLRGHGA
jgi:hypothetical protein